MRFRSRQGITPTERPIVGGGIGRLVTATVPTGSTAQDEAARSAGIADRRGLATAPPSVVAPSNRRTSTGMPAARVAVRRDGTWRGPVATALHGPTSRRATRGKRHAAPTGVGSPALTAGPGARAA